MQRKVPAKTFSTHTDTYISTCTRVRTNVVKTFFKAPSSREIGRTFFDIYFPPSGQPTKNFDVDFIRIKKIMSAHIKIVFST